MVFYGDINRVKRLLQALHTVRVANLAVALGLNGLAYIRDTFCENVHLDPGKFR